MKKKIHVGLISTLYLASIILLFFTIFQRRGEVNPNKSLSFGEEGESRVVSTLDVDDYTVYNSLDVMATSSCKLNDASILNATCHNVVKITEHNGIQYMLVEIQREVLGNMRKVSYMYALDIEKGSTTRKRIEAITGRTSAIASDFIIHEEKLLLTVVEYSDYFNDKAVSYVKALNLNLNVVSNHKVVTKTYAGVLKSIAYYNNSFIFSTYVNEILEKSVLIKTGLDFKVSKELTLDFTVGQVNIIGDRIHLLHEINPYIGGYINTGDYSKLVTTLNEVVNNPYNNFIGTQGVVLVDASSLEIKEIYAMYETTCSLINGVFKEGISTSYNGKNIIIQRGCFTGSHSVYFDSGYGYIIQVPHYISGVAMYSFAERKTYSVSIANTSSSIHLMGVDSGKFIYASSYSSNNAQNLIVVDFGPSVLKQMNVSSFDATKTYKITNTHIYETDYIDHTIKSYMYRYINDSVYRFNGFIYEKVGN